MAVTQTEIANLSEYVGLLLTDPPVGRLWYRGQGCADRPLRPSLIRRLNPFSAAALIAKEQALITRFRQRSLPLWPEGYPQNDWEQLFAMQHFGVPTRLLDWSESALVAAYFAADHDSARCECKTGTCSPTVWVLNPVQLNRLNSRFEGYGDSLEILSTSSSEIEPWQPGTEETRFAPWPIALHGTHNSTRIVAQQGTFTVSGKMHEPLEMAPAAKDHEGVLKKLVFECSHAELLAQLRVLGVTRPTVYPDLPSIAYDIANEELNA